MKHLLDLWGLLCWVCVAVTALCWWILLAIAIYHSHPHP